MVTPDQVDAAMPSDESSGARRLETVMRWMTELPPSVANALKPVVAGLVEQVRIAIEQLSLTAAQIATLVANPGAIAPTTVTASGQISSAAAISAAGAVTAGGDLSTGGKLLALSVFNTTLPTNYRAVWSTGVDGQLGYVPSSERFKQDITAAVMDPTLMCQLQLVTFRYIAAVEQLGDDAATEIGLIAEHVHALGQHWLVDYDEDGLPFGVKYERLVLVVMAWGQRAEERLAAIETHLGLDPLEP